MVQVTDHLTVRCKFCKIGDLQYISHLDLVRTMSKIIIRANLPLWYTEGFNPKPKMAFAAPLSIGTESVCEIMDLRLTHRMPPDEVKARLNANMDGQMQITDVWYPETKLSSIGFLSYEITVHSPLVSASFAKTCESILTAPEVLVTKKGKEEEAPVNIRPLIKEVKTALKDGDMVVTATLSADPANFLNPEYLIKVLKREVGLLSDDNLLASYYTVKRTGAFAADMTEFR